MDAFSPAFPPAQPVMVMAMGTVMVMATAEGITMEPTAMATARERTMKICDIHTHVLPGVDDGAQNLEQSLQMLENAVASDVAYLAVTPHCNRGGETCGVSLQSQFELLRKAAEHLPVKLALGAEVHVTENLPFLLQKGAFPTINDSRYLLTEFPAKWKGCAFLPMLEQILGQGYIPLVAHPERYEAVWNAPEMLYDWLDLGCHIQLTAGSILGKYGKSAQKSAEFLLKNGLACCVASDAHGVDSRNNNLLEVQSYLALYYSRQSAKALLWENPMTVFGNGSF